MPTLPSLFISHGSPMHAVNAGAAGVVWAALAEKLPRPKAVLMVTAHWESRLPTFSGSATPPMIYDFGGFPEALYRINYPAPGAPTVALRAQSLLTAAGIDAGIDHQRGFDHGTWVPLLKMYPNADIPIVQLSVQTAMSAKHHLDVGRALAPLADEGVLIVGSGHLTHNLRDWMQSANVATPLAYATKFQEWVYQRLIVQDEDALCRYRQLSPDAARAHPSEEHFLPLLVAVGAAKKGVGVARLYAGFEGAALAMDVYRFG